MPPKQRKSRQPSQQLSAVSDYESDTAAAALTDNTSQPLIPAPPVRTNEELNLLVLRRWQPNITHILTIAPFAVLYLFSAESQGWEKCEVQGSLFLCSLRIDDGGSAGAYKLLILNRKGLENWEFDIRNEEAIQFTEEYVIVQKEDEQGEEQIYGIWIFEDKGGQTRDVVGRAIVGCAREVEALAGQEEGYEDANEGEEDVVKGYDRTYAEEYASQQRHESNGRDVGEEVWPRQATPRQHQHQQQPQSFEVQQSQGLQIDLTTLFNKSGCAPSVQPPQTETSIGGTIFTSIPFAEERLAAASDTDRYRETSTNPSTNAEYQQTTQQNTLLDLFKNAKRG